MCVPRFSDDRTDDVRLWIKLSPKKQDDMHTVGLVVSVARCDWFEVVSKERREYGTDTLSPL